MRGITVIDVFREVGAEPTKDKTWAVGQMMQAHYAREHGHQPPKDLRVKTCGVGVHCFAIYPVEYRQVIASYIKRVNADAERQMALI